MLSVGTFVIQDYPILFVTEYQGYFCYINTHLGHKELTGHVFSRLENICIHIHFIPYLINSKSVKIENVFETFFKNILIYANTY